MDKSLNRPFADPARTSKAARTSNALPKAGASGAFISEIMAEVLQPAAFAVSTKDFAKSRASAGVCINAPLPHFTSNTNPCNPAANFFDRIEAVIKSKLSTVPVTSRTAYKRRSAGAISPVAPAMTQPAVDKMASKCGLSNCVRRPGIASNLSNVPPVWPNPRPDIIGTTTPAAAKSGARISETQSPIPPVECLSKIGASKSQDSVAPLSRMASVRSRRPASPKPFRHTAMAKAPACASLAD